MVQEVRRIILNREEILTALNAHSRVTPEFLTSGLAVNFSIADQDSIDITVEAGLGGAPVNIVCEGAKLQPALIRFCLENNIMLPREGRKSVSIAADHIALCIDLEVETYLTSIADSAGYGSFFALHAFAR